jgi:hypothetical protein
MCLWLKLGALAGWRTARVARFDTGLVVAALLLGTAISLSGQMLWGALGPRLVARLGGEARARDLRLGWGAAFFPSVGVLALLPLDLMIVGRGVFSIDPLADPIATAWAATSIALGVALLAWSAWLFLRGVQVASSLRMRWALLASLGAAFCAAAPVGGLVLIERLMSGGAPT